MAKPYGPLNPHPSDVVREQKARIVRECEANGCGRCVGDFLRSDGVVVLTFENGHVAHFVMPKNAVNPNPNGDWK